jgi:integrase
MSLTKRGNIWHIHFHTPDGRRIRESTGTPDRKEAQEYHDRLKAQYWRNQALGEKPDRTWREAVVQFLRETEHKASRNGDIQKLKWLDRRFGKLNLSQVTRDKIAKIGDIKRKDASAATANRYLALIRTILRKAALEWEWIQQAPKVRLYPEPKSRIRWLNRGEADRLLQELPDHLEKMARFSLATGLRWANVSGLEWSQVDMHRRCAWIHPDQAKAKKAIQVPLNEEALAVLQQQVGQHLLYVFTYRGRRIKQGSRASWRKAKERAGITDFRWHDLRHTWASWHVQAGTPLHVLQELGGWSSIEMVQRYAHLGGQHLASYASAISPGYDTNTTQPVLRVV